MSQKVISNKRQLSRLVQLMEEDIELAKGFCSKAGSQTKWARIAIELNSLGPPERTSEKWQRVWIDLKCKIKKKQIDNKIEISATGGGPNRLHNLSDLEEAVTGLLALDKCINPPGRQFGLDNVNNSNITEKITDDVPHENLNQIHPVSIENVEQPKKKTPRKEKLQEDRISLLEDQTVDQKNYHENMLNIMGDIKKSLCNIEYYTKEKFQISKEYKEEILKIKKEKLKLYKTNKENKEKGRKDKLKLKMELLELKKQKLDICK